MGQLQIAIYMAQEAWLRADRVFDDRVLAGIAPGARPMNEAERVEAAATALEAAPCCPATTHPARRACTS